MAEDIREGRELDRVDRGMLALLVADGRASVRSLAERLHISRANAYARLQRLREAGVIRGFTADVHPERAGLGTSAYVTLTIEQNAWRQVADALRRVRYVEHVALVGAEVDVVVLVRAPDNATLRGVVFDDIQPTPGVLSTRTWLIFSEEAGPGPRWAD